MIAINRNTLMVQDYTDMCIEDLMDEIETRLRGAQLNNNQPVMLALFHDACYIMGYANLMDDEAVYQHSLTLVALCQDVVGNLDDYVRG